MEEIFKTYILGGIMDTMTDHMVFKLPLGFTLIDFVIEISSVL